MSDISEVAIQARQLAEHIAEDITNTQSRGEYIRLTQLAMEADRLATQLEKMNVKDV
jgi:hypothetical protein